MLINPEERVPRRGKMCKGKMGLRNREVIYADEERIWFVF